MTRSTGPLGMVIRFEVHIAVTAQRFKDQFVRNLAVVVGLVCLLYPLSVFASDFEETQQDVQDSAFHASMQGDRLMQDPGVRELIVAGTAYIDCVRAERDKGDTPAAEVVKSCATTRAAYAALLPKENAEFELGLLEKALMPQPASTEL